MKQMFIAVMATVALFSCKPSDQLLPAVHNGPGSYRVGFVSKSAGDTTWTNTRIAARVETTGLDSAQDSKLKAVLLTYAHGVYTLQGTNLTNCQQIIRWNWEGGFRIDSIAYPEPSTGPNDPQNDVLKAGETKIFTIYGPAKTGKLKLKAESTCGNSSTLIINITTTILPIKYADYAVAYDNDLGRVLITFTIFEPTDLKQVIIQHLDGHQYRTVLVMLGDDNITKYNVKLP